MKETGLKGLRTVWFHLYELPDKIVVMEKRSVVDKGLGVGEKGVTNYKEITEGIFWVMKLFYILIATVVIGIYVCVKICWTLHTKRGSFTKLKTFFKEAEYTLLWKYQIMTIKLPWSFTMNKDMKQYNNSNCMKAQKKCILSHLSKIFFPSRLLYFKLCQIYFK